MTLDLHYPTLVFSMIVVTVLTTLLLAVAAWTSLGRRELRLWSLGNVLQCVGLLMTAGEDLPFVVHAVLGYGVMTAGLGALFAGLQSFAGRSGTWRWVAGAFIVGMLGPAFFAYIEPQVEMRQQTAAVALALMSLLCAVWLFRYARKGLRVAAWVTGAGFLAVVGAALWWLVLQHLGGPRLDALQEALPARLFTAMLVPAAQIVILFGLVLMVLSRNALSLEHLSVTDALTGTLNRGGLEALARRHLVRGEHENLHLSALMLDADHFKRVNDTYGHAVGDAVLQQLAKLTQAALRPEDLLGRYGGEEFVAILVGATPDEARRVAERLRQAVEASQMAAGAAGKGLGVSVTISIGVAHARDQGYDLERLVHAADEALYRAKREGRNRVCVAPPAAGPGIRAPTPEAVSDPARGFVA